MAGAALAAVAAFVTLSCWAISSPAGSSPDELFHLNSIWCGHGVDEDTCQATSDEAFRVVPHQVVTPGCFIQNGAVSAACRPDDTDDAMTPDTRTDMGNWNANGYPRVYYFVASFLVVGSLDAAVTTIRVANSLIAVALIAGLAWLLPRRLALVAPVAFLATAVPLSLFTVASTNPSSWAILSSGLMWLAVYGAYEARGRRQAALLVFAVVVAVMGAGARTDAAIFTVLGVAVALGLRLGAWRAQWRATLVGAVIAASATAMYFSSASRSAATTGLGGYERMDISGAALFASNLVQVPFFWTSALGFGPMAPLGWFDTGLPFIVGFGGVIAFATLCFQGWASMWWKKVVALTVVALALTAYPLVILQLTHILAGNGVQPRYLLPMLVMFTGVSLLPAVGDRLTVNRAQAVALVLALSVAQSIALYANLWRYVRGVTGSMQWIGDYTWWWGGLVPSPVAVWVIGSCAFAVTSAVLLAGLVPPSRAVATIDLATRVAADDPEGPPPDAALTAVPETAAAGSPRPAEGR